MYGREHLGFGIVSGACVGIALAEVGVVSTPAALGIAGLSAIGGLLPDADHRYSKINSLFPPAKLIHYIFGQRGLFHDPVFWGIVAYAMAYFGANLAWFGIIFGVAGHLFLDSFTYDGIPILALIKVKERDKDGRRKARFNFHMVPRGMRFFSKSTKAVVVTWLFNALTIAATFAFVYFRSGVSLL